MNCRTGLIGAALALLLSTGGSVEAEADDLCGRVTIEYGQPDTLRLECTLPGRVVEIIISYAEDDSVVVMPDGTRVPWPPDTGALPPEEDWIPYFSLPGHRTGVYLLTWNGVPFDMKETSPSGSFTATVPPTPVGSGGAAVRAIWIGDDRSLSGG